MNEVNEGRVALVTGASRGLGRAIAIRLAGSGHRVVINFAVLHNIVLIDITKRDAYASSTKVTIVFPVTRAKVNEKRPRKSPSIVRNGLTGN